MDRRNTLKWLGFSTLGLIVPALAASQSTDEVLIDATAAGDAEDTLSGTSAVACRVIGVGDTGCNILLAAWSSGMLEAKDCLTEFACVSMGRQSNRAVIEANRLHPGIAPIRTVQLGPFGAGGSLHVASAAARKHDKALRSLIVGADLAILVAGIGGGTGSAVAPILASMAEESGALVLGVVVTPFNWELGRYPNAFSAVKALERHSHYLVSLPNEEMGELLGMDATLDGVIAHQEALAIACLSKLLLDGSRFCTDRWRHPA